MDNQIYSKLITLKWDEIASLYRLREHHLLKLRDAVIKQGLSDKSDDIEVEQTIKDETASLKEIEFQLTESGMPLSHTEVGTIYRSINEVIGTLKSAQQIRDWIKITFPEKYNEKKSILYSDNLAIEPRLTGEWKGFWKSDKFTTSHGDLVMATCQIGNNIIGSGAFQNSVLPKSYIEGSVDENNLKIEILSDKMPIKGSVIAELIEEKDDLLIDGIYDIMGFDTGAFQVKRSRMAQEINDLIDKETEQGKIDPKTFLFGIDIDSLKDTISNRAGIKPLNNFSIDLIDEVMKVEKIGELDVEAAIGKARKISEMIVSDLCSNMPIDRELPLFNKIKLLYERNIIDRKINTYFHTIRTIGNLSVHYGINKKDSISVYDMKLIGIMTALIVEWYILKG